MEHNPFWRETFDNMLPVLPIGRIVQSAKSLFVNDEELRAGNLVARGALRLAVSIGGLIRARTLIDSHIVN
jgi:hypothetical protein